MPRASSRIIREIATVRSTSNRRKNNIGTEAGRNWTLEDSYAFIGSFMRKSSQDPACKGINHVISNGAQSGLLLSNQLVVPKGIHPIKSLNGTSTPRFFHDYFVTYLPSSSLQPDSRSPRGLHHKLPRAASTPHPPGPGPSPATPPQIGTSRDTTVVRIPLRSAKHHFGAFQARGTRPYNEDTYQAGVIELPAFAKRVPMSLTRSRGGPLNGEGTSAEGASGDPQVFYFGVFDGHGGSECSNFLRDKLHVYIEDAGKQFELQSTLKKKANTALTSKEYDVADVEQEISTEDERKNLRHARLDTQVSAPSIKLPKLANNNSSADSPESLRSASLLQTSNIERAKELEDNLVRRWRKVVGGYFRRFKPEYFSTESGGQGHTAEIESPDGKQSGLGNETQEDGVAIETVVSYAFLKADLDFITMQAKKKDTEDVVQEEKALNENDILGEPSKIRTTNGDTKRFKGGSTCSVAMISTPTASPFWHPSSPSSLVVSHVGDTRILLCTTATGLALPLTTNHHPSSPGEGNRLRRYARTFVTDSFGEERMSGLANTRAFGDMQSKRIGVSAEPEIKRIDLGPAQFSFLVLMSDGVSGTLNDQEIVDIVKESKTPEQAAKDVVNFAADVSTDGDNCTCLVVRLGGWERRSEGGLGSMGTKEIREWRMQDATDPRSRRT